MNTWDDFARELPFQSAKELLGCPVCQSDDYIELDSEDGLKQCQECGEEWE